MLAEIYIQSSKYDLASSLCHLAKAGPRVLRVGRGGARSEFLETHSRQGSEMHTRIDRITIDLAARRAGCSIPTWLCLG